MIATRLSRLTLALSLSFGLAAAGARALADGPSPWEPVEAAIAAAEKDPAQIAAARVAVDAAILSNPKAVGVHLLSVKLWMIQALAAKKGDEKKAAYEAALSSCTKAQEIDPRDPAPWRLRVDVLTLMGTDRNEVTEALRGLSIRLGNDPQARENYKRQTGKVPPLKVGDPMPFVVWKDSAGKDVKVADLWVAKPLVIELFRTTTWCEFCRKRLYELHDHAADFEVENVTLVAVSPDTIEKIATVEKDGLKGRKPFKVRLLNDPKGSQADVLGVLNPDTVKPGTAADAFGLPFPTTIIVDETGVIRFIETHQDFKDRTKIDEIIAAVRRIRSPVAPK